MRVKVLAVETDADGGADPWCAAPIWLAVEDRTDDAVSGTITESRLDRAGYLASDPICVPLDRIFDLVSLGSDGRPILNEERAEFAIGKRVLVGITVLTPGGELIEQRQFVGQVASVDPAKGIELNLANRTSYWLPPDARLLEEAAPGEYRLRSTGEIVTDPDYISTWTITQHKKGGRSADVGHRT
jgi:hypothetical protein